jgi:hypothetical protein
MAGLVPAIHIFGFDGALDVDARHKAGHDGLKKRVTFLLTFVTVYVTLLPIALCKGRHREGALDWAERVRCPRAERHTPLPGGFGHHADRHYDRSVGCNHWTGIDEGG